MYTHALRFAVPSFVLAIAIAAASASAAVTPSQVEVPLLSEQPTIDGKISAAEKAACVAIPLQRTASIDPARHATTAYVGVTLRGLYVGFVAEDSDLSSLVGADTAKNGAVFQDDSVQVFVSPTLDVIADGYYHFAINAFGVTYSSNLMERSPVADWQAATSRASSTTGTQTGGGAWEAEIFIPLSAINAPDELPGWRANFARYRPARGSESAETSAWMDTGVSLFNYRKFGYLKMPRLVPAPAGTRIGDDQPAQTTTTAEGLRISPTAAPATEDAAATMAVSQPVTP